MLPVNTNTLVIQSGKADAMLADIANALASARGMGTSHVDLSDNPSADALQKSAERANAKLIITNCLDDPASVAATSALARSSCTDFFALRAMPRSKFKRITVLGGRGLHALVGLRAAKDLASTWGITAQVVYVVQEDRHSADRENLLHRMQQIKEEIQLHMSMLGVSFPLTLYVSTDIGNTVNSLTREDDLVIMGAPTSWLFPDGQTDAKSCFYQRIKRPLLVTAGNVPRRMALKEVFWEDTIRVGLEASSKWEAINKLVDALVDAGQVPANRRREICDAAFRREYVKATAIDSEIAIPHAAIPAMRGLIGCMGILKKGIPFSDRKDRSARFVFLLITPQNDYSDYLAVLSQIAHLMGFASNRRFLAECVTSGQAATFIAKFSYEFPGCGKCEE